MAYSELIKDFDRIRDYMQQFYVYGFKNRMEYTQKSARSYDNERRRLESWLADFMRFRQTPDGKNIFLSVDSRSVPENPFYKAFKAKSFTAGDVTFHFYVLDILQPGVCLTVQQILDRIYDGYLCHFEGPWQPDISTVRKKLNKYVALGILQAEKRGRELYYSRCDDGVELQGWADAVAFYSEADPLGVIGSTLLDKLSSKPELFQFKHHYMLHALNSRVLLQLLTAIGEKRQVTLLNLSRNREKAFRHLAVPLKIFVSTQGGRQYLLCYHKGFQDLRFFRLDYIKEVTTGAVEEDYDSYAQHYARCRNHLWGVSGSDFRLEHLEMTVHFEDNEPFIPQRLEREKRNGWVEYIDKNTCRYTVDTYDASELIPWLRTFIGRIQRLECSNRWVVKRFYDDLALMCRQYGGE